MADRELRECVVCGCVHLSDELNEKDKEIAELRLVNTDLNDGKHVLEQEIERLRRENNSLRGQPND